MQPSHQALSADYRHNLDPSTPAARIEMFLSDNEAIFGENYARWAETRALRDEHFIPAVTELFDVAHEATRQAKLDNSERLLLKSSRRVRKASGHSKRIATITAREKPQHLDYSLAAAHTNACEAYRILLEQNKDQGITNMQIVEVGSDFLNVEEMAKEFKEPYLESEPRAQECLINYLTAQHDYCIAYMLGFSSQDNVVGSVERLLQDDNLIMPFLKRIQTLNADPSSGDGASRGLLQALAVHVYTEKDNNILHKALVRAMQNPDTQKDSYAQALLNDERLKGVRKRALIDIAGMQMLLQIFEDFGHTRGELKERVVSRFGDYAELKNDFDNYITQQVAAEWKTVKEYLQPHLKKARVTTPSDGTQMTAQQVYSLPPAIRESVTQRHRAAFRQAPRPFELLDI